MNGEGGHLDRLLDMCHARGLPLLTAICVNQEGLRTGHLSREALAGFIKGIRRRGYQVVIQKRRTSCESANKNASGGERLLPLPNGLLCAHFPLLYGYRMSDRQYWLDLFTYKTWTEFLKAGAKVSGFRDNRWNAVQKIRPGDYMLCYLTGVSRWIGLLEVTGKPYVDDKTRIWDYDVFPARVPVKALIALEPETAVPIFELKNQLSIFRDLKSPNAWTGAVRGSPAKWSATDGAVVIAAIEHADKTREKRPFDPLSLRKRHLSFAPSMEWSPYPMPR